MEGGAIHEPDIHAKPVFFEKILNPIDSFAPDFLELSAGFIALPVDSGVDSAMLFGAGGGFRIRHGGLHRTSRPVWAEGRGGGELKLKCPHLRTPGKR